MKHRTGIPSNVVETLRERGQYGGEVLCNEVERYI